MPRKQKIDTIPIRLPDKLIEEVERFISEHPELGYTSVPEFIREAIRDYLLYLKTSSSEQQE